MVEIFLDMASCFSIKVTRRHVPEDSTPYIHIYGTISLVNAPLSYRVCLRDCRLMNGALHTLTIDILVLKERGTYTPTCVAVVKLLDLSIFCSLLVA